MKLQCWIWSHKVDRLTIKRAMRRLSWMNPFAPVYVCERCGYETITIHDGWLGRPVFAAWYWIERKAFLLRCDLNRLRDRLTVAITGKEDLPF